MYIVLYYTCYAAKRRQESKNVGEYKQQDNTESAQYISNKQISKNSMLCINYDLPEVRILIRTHRLWCSRTAVQVGCLEEGYVRCRG